jgi:hypothetical protein
MTGRSTEGVSPVRHVLAIPSVVIDHQKDPNTSQNNNEAVSTGVPVIDS